ncbi:MAG: response regulator transcription factor [Planctomycetes bacterium]|nr:response regulator transcription factor [Planctomycetota bacterium]
MRDDSVSISGFRADAPGRKLPPTPWGLLPPKMRVLLIHSSMPVGRWLKSALDSDNACEVALEEVRGVALALVHLRDEVFDAILLCHETGELNALESLDAIRAGSSDEQPILVLGTVAAPEMTDLCYESGADAYLCIHTTTTRTLLWELARARERQQLLGENRRMRLAQHHRLQQEHDESARLLRQQRSLIAGLELIEGSLTIDVDGEPAIPERSHAGGDGVAAATVLPPLPESLRGHYRELLRTYVIMGSGNLAEEMTRLAEMLINVELTPRQLMLLHLQVLEEIIATLGSRSARHVLNRADLLILEVMMNLADGYRVRQARPARPPRQRFLPGFDPSSQRAAG